MDEKTKETALEILQEMQKDKWVELSPDNLYFNKMCLGCKRNCVTCIGFSLSCMIDNVIAVTEHASEDLWYSLDEYKKCRRFFFSETGNEAVFLSFCAAMPFLHTAQDII